MNFWLIQRGKFKDSIKDPNGIDDIIQFDYMGSAEFEYGTLPKALKEIVSKISQLKIHMVSSIANFKGERLFIICTDEQLPEVTQFLKEEADDDMKHRLKERTEFRRAVTGKDWNNNPVQEYTLQNFWWDITNNWMACFSKTHASLVMDALLKVKVKKGW